MDPTRSLPPSELLRHSRFVRALARDLLGDEHLSEDVVQETWLRWLQRPPRALDPRAWLSAVARNLARNTARSESYRRSDDLTTTAPASAPAADSDLEHAALLRSVVDAVLALEEPYRSTILHRYYRDWDARKIAEETSTPIATVRSRLQRAHAILRERLDRVHGGRPSWTAALAPLCGIEAASSAAGAGALQAAITAAILVAAASIVAVLVLRHARPTGEPAQTARSVVSPAAEREIERAEPALAQAATVRESRSIGAREILRISGTVDCLPYSELALAGGPARRLSLHLRLGPSGFFNSGDLGKVDTVTDDSGAFAVELPLPSSPSPHLNIYSEQDETYRGVRFERAIEPGTTAVEDLRLHRAAHGLLSGRVVDPRGQPIPACMLEVRNYQTNVQRPVLVRADDRGEFKTPWRGSVAELQSSTPGMTVIRWDAPPVLDAGGSGPLVAVLTRAASARVRVVDGEDRGVEGLRVSVELDTSEQRTIGGQRQGFADTGQVRSTVTDARGIAELADVWADRKLVVRVQGEMQGLASSSCRGNHLLFGVEADGGEPILLGPGESRDLVATWRADLAISGKVVFQDGRPATGVSVRFRDLGDRTYPGGTILGSTQSGPTGEFETRLRAFEIVGPLEIAAAEKPSTSTQRLVQLGYIGDLVPTDGAMGAVVIDPASAVDHRLEVTVVLKPTLSMEGRLFDSDGKAIAQQGQGHRVWAVPAGSPPRGPTKWIVPPEVGFESDGRFRVFGLSEGLYDILVSDEIQSFYSFESFVHPFPGIPAGTAGLELRLPKRKEVHIHVRLRGGEPSNMIVLHAKLYPRDPNALASSVASHEMRISDASGWPEGTMFGFGGIGGHADDLGTWLEGYYGTDETTEHGLPPFGPGWYVIGIRPSSNQGQEIWAAQATKPCWFDEGEYTIEFDVVRSATLEGRVLGDVTHEHLAVALADAEGRLVPLETQPGSGEPRHVLEVDAQGRFVLRHAPVGKFVLRAGNRADLERGVSRKEIDVEIRERENPVIEVRL